MSDQAAPQGRPRPASVRMRRAPHQILAGVPGPRGCPRIQAGDVSQGRRALGGSDALERKTVVLPEFLGSHLMSCRWLSAISFQTNSSTASPSGTLFRSRNSQCLRQQHISSPSCGFLPAARWGGTASSLQKAPGSWDGCDMIRADLVMDKGSVISMRDRYFQKV